MKLTDIIALAKLGYKKSDIEDLIQMADTAEPASSTGTESPDDTSGHEEPEITGQGDEPEQTADDHTEKYKALEDQISDLKKQLALAQQTNINKNISSDQDEDVDFLQEIAKNFM